MKKKKKKEKRRKKYTLLINKGEKKYIFIYPGIRQFTWRATFLKQ